MDLIPDTRKWRPAGRLAEFQLLHVNSHSQSEARPEIVLLWFMTSDHRVGKKPLPVPVPLGKKNQAGFTKGSNWWDFPKSASCFCMTQN